MKSKLIKKQGNELIFETYGNINAYEVDKFYDVEIKDYKKNRSLDQNAMLWAIIQEIAKETGNDPWNLYLDGLENAGVLVEWIETLPEAQETLKRVYRIVELKERRKNINNVNVAVFKCYVGSSLFNTKEMTLLVDYFINLASSYGIEVIE